MTELDCRTCTIRIHSLDASTGRSIPNVPIRTITTSYPPPNSVTIEARINGIWVLNEVWSGTSHAYAPFDGADCGCVMVDLTGGDYVYGGTDGSQIYLDVKALYVKTQTATVVIRTVNAQSGEEVPDAVVYDRSPGRYVSTTPCQTFLKMISLKEGYKAVGLTLDGEATGVVTTEYATGLYEIQFTTLGDLTLTGYVEPIPDPGTHVEITTAVINPETDDGGTATTGYSSTVPGTVKAFLGIGEMRWQIYQGSSDGIAYNFFDILLSLMAYMPGLERFLYFLVTFDSDQVGTFNASTVINRQQPGSFTVICYQDGGSPAMYSASPQTGTIGPGESVEVTFTRVSAAPIPCSGYTISKDAGDSRGYTFENSEYQYGNFTITLTDDDIAPGGTYFVYLRYLL